MNRPVQSDVVVERSGGVPPDIEPLARSTIEDVARHTSEPVLFARIKLTLHRSEENPALAQANLDVNGRLVRAQAAAPAMHEAIELLRHRLVERVERGARNWEARRGDVPAEEEHEWRHGQQPAPRPAYFPRPAAEREIIRHKSYTLAEETPDEAAFDMDQMDYDFELFTDIGNGLDAVIYRAGPTGYRLAYASETDADTPEVTSSAVPLTVSRLPAPRLDTSTAIERLEVTGWPFVFYVSPASGRGHVLYRRYDGHYGLITPSTAD